MGIEEKYITGNATDEEKFQKWAETVPYSLRNPLYHWTHLELSRYFGIDELLDAKSASDIYRDCNKQLENPDFSSQNLIRRMNVEVVCTTDDPLDDLRYHSQLAESDYSVNVLPTFRPDGLIDIEKVDFIDYLNTLSKITGIEITDFDSLKEVIRKRVDYFHENGCRLSDHGLSHAYGVEYTEDQVNTILSLRLGEKSISKKEVAIYKTAILNILGQLYHEKNWVMQSRGKKWFVLKPLMPVFPQDSLKASFA